MGRMPKKNDYVPNTTPINTKIKNPKNKPNTPNNIYWYLLQDN
jgi:hypothetical protein